MCNHITACLVIQGGVHTLCAAMGGDCIYTFLASETCQASDLLLQMFTQLDLVEEALKESTGTLLGEKTPSNEQTHEH